MFLTVQPTLQSIEIHGDRGNFFEVSRSSDLARDLIQFCGHENLRVESHFVYQTLLYDLLQAGARDVDHEANR